MKPRSRVYLYWVSVLALLLLGIPWYRTPGTQDPLVLGMPMWASVALVSAIAIAALTAWAALRLWHAMQGDAHE